jgi:acyl-CoA reductase-like NAD-dependent aldehyde dehydrogenase
MTQGEREALEATVERVRVNKTYKMFVGGAFVRSESGRCFQVSGVEGAKGADADPAVVNIPRGSRKDARDAVSAAKRAFPAWASRSAYNRGQILYRLAEVLEARRPELVHSLLRAGVIPLDAEREVDVAVDTAVYYAGFSDKFQSLLASRNPVNGPFFGVSAPEPLGVDGLLAPSGPTLAGLVSSVLPILVGGNTVLAVAHEADPRTAIVLCECIATSDFPAGVVNVLTGFAGEIGPVLADHREVAGVDVWSEDAALVADVERRAAAATKRVRRHDAPTSLADWSSGARRGLGAIEAFVETKTIWHPVAP